MKQAGLGILVIIMIVLVFSTESILAILRVRTVDITVDILDARTGAVATQEPTAAAGSQATAQATDKAGGQPKEQAAVLTIRPGNALVVHAHWDFRIGPRFPQTIVYAEVLDQSHTAIATDQFTIDCGSETLNCGGDHDLRLDYTGKTPQATASNPQVTSTNPDSTPTVQRAPHIDWPEGDYILHVTRTYVGLKPQDLMNDSFHVRAAP